MSTVQRTSARETDPRLAEVADILRHLHKVLGICRLYARGNELVTTLEAKLGDALGEYTRAHGSLCIGVRPNSFAYGKEAIEGSGLDELALSLFRQGIISLTMDEAFCGPPLSEFVDLLNEGMLDTTSSEDLATRLWRAELPGLTYKAVLGYQEAGDEDEEIGVDEGAIGSTLDEIAGFEYDGGEPADGLEGVDMKADFKEGQIDLTPALQSLVTSLEPGDADAWRQDHIRFVRQLFSHRGADQVMSPDEDQPMIEQYLEAVVRSGERSALEEHRLWVTSLEGGAFGSSISSLRPLSDKQLLLFLESALGRPDHDRTGLLSMLTDHVGGDRGRLMGFAELVDKEPMKELIAEAVAAASSGDVDFLLTAFRSAEADGVGAALGPLLAADRARAQQALAVRLASSEPAVQAELLKALSEAPDLYDRRMGAALVRLVAKAVAVRAPLLELLLAKREPQGVRVVAGMLQDDAFLLWDESSMLAALRYVLAMVADDSAVKLVRGLLKKKGLLKRKAIATMKGVAVQALAVSRSEAAKRLLIEVTETGDKALRPLARRGLEKWKEANP